MAQRNAPSSSYDEEQGRDKKLYICCSPVLQKDIYVRCVEIHKGVPSGYLKGVETHDFFLPYAL